MKFNKSYNPADFEPDIYALWEGSDAFKPNLTKTKTPYTIDMPPPNANGNLHIGHGLTIAIEDALIRYHRLCGHPTWYIPGADHAGFETWVVYEKYLESQGKTRFDFTRDELYQQTWDFVATNRGNMELQLRALGASCDWSALTFTLDPKVVNTVYDTFERLWKDGLVYRGERLVNYCTKHQTAFADIEVDHEEETGTLWDIAYPFADGSGEIVISTTRPETLLGDTAVAVDPDDTRYTTQVGKMLKLPLTDREIPVIADNYVEQDFGTGAVKITPAHDQNDYEVGQRHGLEIISVIGFDGKMTPAAGDKYVGKTVLEARELVLADLEAAGLRRGEKSITHSVGHCYKCGTVIEPLLKEQWFIEVAPLAQRAIDAIEADKIRFYPANKKRVLVNYFKNLKDWNISRQIPWGIPIPAYQNIDDPTDWVFSRNVEQATIAIGDKTYKRDEDTFDTWFSSGQWPYITTDHLTNPSGFYPLSVMETGSDILFAWIARMIMFGLYSTGDVPFHDVYLHGLVLDEKGQKMSKSKGNVINPMDLVVEYGSDAFRLGILANRSAGQNQAFSRASVIAGRNLCNKLWNIARLIQDIVEQSGDTTDGMDPNAPALHWSAVQSENMGEDWIIREIETTREQVSTFIKSYRLAEAYELLYDLIWNRYADWFIESQKTFKNVNLLKKTLEYLLIMLHPFAPFTTETIWQALSWTYGLCITQGWPHNLTYDELEAGKFETLQTIVFETRKALQALGKGKKHQLLFGDEPLVADNAPLIQALTRVSAIDHADQPSGLRLPVPNHELYLDIPQADIDKHKQSLEERIQSLSGEIATLEGRLANPAYTAKAPAPLVEQTRSQLTEKQALLQKLQEELTVI